MAFHMREMRKSRMQSFDPKATQNDPVADLLRSRHFTSFGKSTFQALCSLYATRPSPTGITLQTGSVLTRTLIVGCPDDTSTKTNSCAGFSLGTSKWAFRSEERRAGKEC